MSSLLLVLILVVLVDMNMSRSERAKANHLADIASVVLFYGVVTLITIAIAGVALYFFGAYVITLLILAAVAWAVLAFRDYFSTKKNKGQMINDNIH